MDGLMPCLVTGGAGFIGSHLVHELVRRGHPVRVVDDLSTGSRANLERIAPHVELVVADLRDPKVCQRAVRGIDVVFHVAALPSVPRSFADPWLTHDVNVNATVHLLNACIAAGVRRVVYSSSSSVYGDTEVLPKAEAVEPLPRSPYAVSKLSGEQYVLAMARAGVLEGVALRYFNVFGPRQSPDSPYAAVIPLFLRAALEGAVATVYGDGRQTRDFTYVANVVAANLLAATRPAAEVSGHACNVGAGERVSLIELLEMIGDTTGRPVKWQTVPPRAGDVRDSQAGLERAGDVLGYMPCVSLADGLRATWEWFHPKPSPAPRIAPRERTGRTSAGAVRAHSRS
jgi:UDP-glucose 4-epimerase